MTIDRKLDVIENINPNIKRFKITSTDDASAVADDIADLQTDDSNTVHVDDDDASQYGFVIDEDNMASDDDTLLPTQQSVKAYVDALADGDVADAQADATQALSDASDIAFGGTAITDLAVDANGTAIATAVNAIIARLVTAGIIVADV